jgi:DGQHR domain-containing protein
MPDIEFVYDIDPIEIAIPATLVQQPVGDMYIASIPHNIITRIAHFDVRRIVREAREVESYLGIQRPLSVKRVEEIGEYVNYYDSSFPSSIIVAIDENYVSYRDGILHVRNFREGEDKPSTAIRDIARVLDGQHRIAGLENFKGDKFDVIVTIFVGADLADQAYIFATVNLEQKRVSKSLAYDLFALARSRSPQKTCHNIAIAFDEDPEGPFYRRIKRLGTASPGRDFETISQATFVDGLMPHISRTPKADRDILLRGRSLPVPTEEEVRRVIFRRMFVAERDFDIAQTVHEFFVAVRERWPIAWAAEGLGYMLNRTNGYRALCRLLKPLYLQYSSGKEIVRREQFLTYLSRSGLRDQDLTTDHFPPGTSGESLLYNQLIVDLDLGDRQQYLL